MIDTFVNLEDYINKCLISKLSKPYFEKDSHPEYQARNNKLQHYFPKLLDLLQNIDFRLESEITSSTLYSLLILFLELKTEGQWNTRKVKAKDYPAALNQLFKTKYDITLEEILHKDSFCVAQDVFDKCIKELHQKMTLDDFRKYPGLIGVYCLLIKNVQDYNVTLNPVTVLPVALLLIDDYIVENKIRGLECCTIILQCLNCNSFAAGNYYDVVYRSLKNSLNEKDITVTRLLFKCIPDLLEILPVDTQKTKLDDMFAATLNLLSVESNLYRKAECYKLATKIIEMHGINCVKKKSNFDDIICDSLECCCQDGVHEILAQPVLECLMMWTRHCWCVWKFTADQYILSVTMKLLYVVKEDSTKDLIQTLFITLTRLCSKEEQKQIIDSLNTGREYPNTDFMERISKIKESLSE